MLTCTSQSLSTRNGFQAQLPSKCHPSSEETDYSLYSLLRCQILLALFHQSHPHDAGKEQTLTLYLALPAVQNESNCCLMPFRRKLRQKASSVIAQPVRGSWGADKGRLSTWNTRRAELGTHCLLHNTGPETHRHTAGCPLEALLKIPAHLSPVQNPARVLLCPRTASCKTGWWGCSLPRRRSSCSLFVLCLVNKIPFSNPNIRSFIHSEINKLQSRVICS